MKISKKHQTILLNLTLAVLGALVSYFTGWLIIIPIIFGIGIPIINLDKPIWQKLAFTVLIVIVSMFIFSGAAIAAISFEMDNYFFPGLVTGLAGIAILGINALVIRSIDFRFKTVLMTFLLAGISMPLWTLLTEQSIPNIYANHEMVRQYGVMVFWMILTTIGIATGIRK